MTEDVLVSVRGLHALDNEQQEEIEVFSAGNYYFQGGKHYILYEEQTDGTGEIVSNRLTLKDGRLELHKRGAVDTTLVFEYGKRTQNCYETPFGNLLVGIDVTEMDVMEREELLEIKVAYRLELNREYVEDCCIRVRVMAKDSGQFHLLGDK